VLGSRFEENFRRATLISRGDRLVFIERPISAFFLALCALLLAGQFYVWLRSMRHSRRVERGRRAIGGGTSEAGRACTCHYAARRGPARPFEEPRRPSVLAARISSAALASTCAMSRSHFAWRTPSSRSLRRAMRL
jgi:hypothetical protein